MNYQYQEQIENFSVSGDMIKNSASEVQENTNDDQMDGKQGSIPKAPVFSAKSV